MKRSKCILHMLQQIWYARRQIHRYCSMHQQEWILSDYKCLRKQYIKHVNIISYQSYRWTFHRVSVAHRLFLICARYKPILYNFCASITSVSFIGDVFQANLYMFIETLFIMCDNWRKDRFSVMKNPFPLIHSAVPVI